MKTFVARCSFTDRRQGPGTGRTLEVQATSMPQAAGRVIRMFWKDLGRKERRDASQGLTVTVLEKKEVSIEVD